MTAVLAELSASSLADICATRPQISTRPLAPSEYYPPGTSRTSKIQAGVDANRIFNTTVGQHSHILQQLEEAERNAKDALFALEMMEMEVTRETATIKSALSHLSEILPPHEFEEMCDFAFGQSKEDWENLWKHEWVDDGKGMDQFVKRPSGSSKRPRPGPQLSHPTSRAPSSPLPPSSPPPPSPTVNSQGRLPPCTSPTRINRIPGDEYQWSTRPRSRLPLDGFGAPWGFVDNFGPTGYVPIPSEPVAGPSQPQQSRRLKRDQRRVEMRQDGTLIVLDPEEDIKAQRRQIKGKMRSQAQERLPTKTKLSLRKLVQPSAVNQIWDPPVTWFRVFGDRETAFPGELTNPFAQGDRIPPMYAETSRTG